MFRTIKNYNDSVKKQLPVKNKNLKTDIKKTRSIERVFLLLNFRL